jgi:hypothetical protein
MKRRLGDRRTLVAGLIIALLALFAIWFVLIGPGKRLVSPPGSAIARFAGSGDDTTETFSVRGGWRIAWESSGEEFAIAIRGDEDLGRVAEVHEPANGVTSPAGQGTFYLEITAAGAWSVTIEQGD